MITPTSSTSYYQSLFIRESFCSFQKKKKKISSMPKSLHVSPFSSFPWSSSRILSHFLCRAGLFFFLSFINSFWALVFLARIFENTRFFPLEDNNNTPTPKKTKQNGSDAIFMSLSRTTFERTGPGVKAQW